MKKRVRAVTRTSTQNGTTNSALSPSGTLTRSPRRAVPWEPASQPGGPQLRPPSFAIYERLRAWR